MLNSQNGDHPKGADDALNAGLQLRQISGDEADNFLETLANVAGMPAEGADDQAAPKNGDFNWPEDYQELPENNPLPDFVDDDIPEAVRNYVLQHALNLQVPMNFILAPLIGAFGSLIGSTLRIHPKERDKWLVCLNFWYLIIGPPSVRKSPAEKAGSAGLLHVSQIEDRRFEEKKAAWKTTRVTLEAERDGLVERIKGLTSGKLKKEKVGTIEDARANLEDVNAKLAAEPRPHVLMTNDATVEKLIELEAYSRNGVTLKRDEIAGWMAKLEGSDSRGDRQIYLEGFEGGNPFRMDRMTRDAPYVSSHTVSIGGTTQPGPIKNLVESSSGLKKQNDGFTQRFSLAVVHPFPTATRYVDELVDPKAETELRMASELVHSWAKGILDREPNGYLTTRFTPDAQLEFKRIYETLQEKSIELEEWPDLQAHVSKYAKLIPALAMTFSVIEAAYKKSNTPPLQANLEHLLLSERWSNILLEHARWLYGAREGMLSPAAFALAEKIKSGKIIDKMSLRQIYRHNWSKIKTEESVRAAIEELAEYSWCAVETEQGSRGAPTMIIRLHPKLRQGSD